MSNRWDIVILGCGQLGGNLKTQLEAEKMTVMGVRRTPSPDDPTLWAMDLDQPDSWDRLAELPVSDRVVWVGIVTPDERTETAYRHRYVGVASRLRQLASLPGRAQPVVWVSSTAVFGEAQTGLLTEETVPHPDHWRGEVVREAERAIEQISAPYCVMRFTGLYSAASVSRLNTQAMRQALSPTTVSNRMHRADAVAWLAHVVSALHQGHPVPKLVHGVDECPATYQALWDRLDGRSSCLQPATAGRRIATRYRSDLPQLTYPSFDRLLGDQ